MESSSSLLQYKGGEILQDLTMFGRPSYPPKFRITSSYYYLLPLCSFSRPISPTLSAVLGYDPQLSWKVIIWKKAKKQI